MRYNKHIFVCINERDPSLRRKSCGKEHGTAIAMRFKELILEHKLRMTVRAQRASCFDFCENGPIAVVYPEGICYKNLTISDVDEIFEQHILNNKPVERLILKFTKK